MSCFDHMRRLRILLALIPVYAAFLCVSAAAQTVDPYTVGGVDVDKTAESAAAARGLALAEGRQLAFRRLLDRLVLDHERPKVPLPAAEQLEGLISGVQIESEKNSQVRYIATLSIGFAADEVRRYLRESGAGFAETFSKPLVVLPVLRREGGDLLWETENSWRKAWAELPRSYALVPLSVPGDDPQLNELINADQALNGEQSRISAVAGRYGAGGVLLAVAAVRTDAETSETVIGLVISRFGTGAADNTEVRSLRAAPDTPVESLLAQAAAQIRADISESWKVNNQIRFEDRATIDATVAFSGLPQWISIRARLESVAAIDQVEIDRISRKKAFLRLHYFGDPAQLRIGLSQRNLDLIRDAENWVIAVVDGTATR